MSSLFLFIIFSSWSFLIACRDDYYLFWFLSLSYLSLQEPSSGLLLLAAALPSLLEIPRLFRNLCSSYCSTLSSYLLIIYDMYEDAAIAPLPLPWASLSFNLLLSYSCLELDGYLRYIEESYWIGWISICSFYLSLITWSITGIGLLYRSWLKLQILSALDSSKKYLGL